MKIVPQLLHFTRLIHHGHDISHMPCILLLAPMVAFEGFFVGEVAHVGEVIRNPFVEMEAPVRKGVG